MFRHTSCSYSRYVTSSTPALASFRRPSKAAINAAGVSRCAIERNRVVLPALASSDNRLSSVDMVLDLCVPPCIPKSGRPDVRPFPLVDSGDASSPPSSVLRASKTPPRPSRQSSVSLDFAVPPRTAATKRSPTFVGNPFESVPRAGTPPARRGPRLERFPRYSLPWPQRRRHPQREKDFGAESARPAPLRVYASRRRSPGAGARLATGLPATALTGLDLHQLDSVQRFHVLITFLLRHAFVARSAACLTRPFAGRAFTDISVPTTIPCSRHTAGRRIFG